MVCASVVHMRLRARAIGTKEVGRCQWHWPEVKAVLQPLASTGVRARFGLTPVTPGVSSRS